MSGDSSYSPLGTASPESHEHSALRGPSKASFGHLAIEGFLNVHTVKTIGGQESYLP